jgi:hypothetical protein
MKKLISLALTICLAFTLVLPASAANAELDSRLSKVTLSVKEILQIGNDYPEFSGNLTEGEKSNQWHLNWSNDQSNIQVTATELGTIVSYYVTDNSDTHISATGELKKFPKLSRAQAEKIAQQFLARVLASRIETATLQEGTNLLAIYNSGDYHFYGELNLHGLKTPIYVNLTVNNAKKAVTSFYRGDSGEDYSSFPYSPKISKDVAASTLFDSVEMQLRYVLSDKDEKKAVLRYFPESKADYVVDALTGKLLEVQSPILYRENSAATADSGSKGYGGLTEVELQAVTDLKGALSSSDLEKAARSISELGISSSFQLSNISYYTEKSEAKDNSNPKIFANLSFDKQNSGAKTGSYSYATKSVILNAKTGELSSCSAYAYSDKEPTISYNQSRSETIARAFAEKYNPSELKETMLETAPSESNDRYQNFTFVRQVNDISFPENAIYITVDKTNGTIGSYSVTWSKDITFADPSGIKTKEEATGLFRAAAGINLCYASVSNGNNQSEMKLVYDFLDQTVWGIDASTGTVLKHQVDSDRTISYTDISGHWAQKQIETLAEYGIGYHGSNSFAPNQNLSQKDALTLIISASGYSLDQSAEDYEDSLYSAAYSMGLLKEADRTPTASVTRSQLTKLIVTAAGYGEVAKLKNIYRIGFQDDKSIQEDLFGYVAIAKGLGIINGDTTGYFHPNNTATRAQLAIILYNIMSR